MTLERLRSWAAKRIVSDEMRTEMGHDLGEARRIIGELRSANGKCHDALGAFREENDRLRASLRDAQDAARAADAKAASLKPWARLGKYVAIGGVAAGGFFIYQSVKP